MVDWDRLLIRTSRPDTPKMLDCWEWLIGRDFRALVMSKFGDWFLQHPRGDIHWLDLLEGTCTQIASTVSEFEQQMIQQEQLDCWFMLPWCYKLYDTGHTPNADQCFGFRVPPKLGAPIELANVGVFNLMAYQVWMSEIHKIPPGISVDVCTIDGKLP